MRMMKDWLVTYPPKLEGCFFLFPNPNSIGTSIRKFVQTCAEHSRSIRNS